jgi:Helix-turn-helix domain
MASGVEMVRGQGQAMKAKGKPKTPPNVEERQQITTMAAAGLSQNKIAKTIGRSRHMVKNILGEAEVKLSIQDEKAELSALYKDKAREVLLSIDADTIAKGNLLQKATSTAILLDKSLILSGDAFPVVNVQILMQVVDAIRSRPQGTILHSQPALPPPEPEP